MRTFRALAVAVVLALVALVVAPAGPAQAARPRLSLLFTSGDTGVVAGNAIWGQRSIQWTAYAAGRPKGSSLVTQTKVGGSWRTIPTTGKKIRKGVASGRYYPVLGSQAYRVALLSRSGKVLAKSKAWRSTGFATVSLARVLTTLPPSIGPVTRTIGGYAYPMLWRLDHVDADVAVTGNSWQVAAGRCRSVRLATSLTYAGGGTSTGSAWFSVGWSPKLLSTLLGDVQAKVSTVDGEVATAATVSSVGSTKGSIGPYSLKPMSWSAPLALAAVEPWPGEAYYGGVGLCSTVVR